MRSHRHIVFSLLALLALIGGFANEAGASRPDYALLDGQTGQLRESEAARLNESGALFRKCRAGNEQCTQALKQRNDKIRAEYHHLDTRVRILSSRVADHVSNKLDQPADVWGDFDLNAKSTDEAARAAEGLRAYHNNDGGVIRLTCKDGSAYAWYDRVFDATIWVNDKDCPEEKANDPDSYASIGGKIVATAGADLSLLNLYQYGYGLDNFKKSAAALTGKGINDETLRVVAKGTYKICETVLSTSPTKEQLAPLEVTREKLVPLRMIYEEYARYEEEAGGLQAAGYLAPSQTAASDRRAILHQLAALILDDAVLCLGELRARTQMALDKLKESPNWLPGTGSDEWNKVCEDTSRVWQAASKWYARSTIQHLALPRDVDCFKPVRNTGPTVSTIAPVVPPPATVPPLPGGGPAPGTVTSNLAPPPAPPQVAMNVPPPARTSRPQQTGPGSSLATITGPTDDPALRPGGPSQKLVGTVLDNKVVPAPGRSGPAVANNRATTDGSTTNQTVAPAQVNNAPATLTPTTTPTPSTPSTVVPQQQQALPQTGPSPQPAPLQPTVANIPTANQTAVTLPTPTVTNDPSAQQAQPISPATDNPVVRPDSPEPSSSSSARSARAIPAATAQPTADPAQAAIQRWANDINEQNMDRLPQDRADVMQALQAKGKSPQDIKAALAPFDTRTQQLQLEGGDGRIIKNTGPQPSPTDTRGPEREVAKLPQGGQTTPTNAETPPDPSQKTTNTIVDNNGGATQKADAGTNPSDVTKPDGTPSPNGGNGGSDITKADGTAPPNGGGKGGGDAAKADGTTTPANGGPNGGSDVTKADGTAPPNGGAKGGSGDIAKGDGTATPPNGGTDVSKDGNTATPSDPAAKPSTVADATSSEPKHSLLGIDPDKPDGDSPHNLVDDPQSDKSTQTATSADPSKGADTHGTATDSASTPGDAAQNPAQVASLTPASSQPGTATTPNAQQPATADGAPYGPVAMVDGHIYSCDQPIGSPGPIDCRKMSADGKTCLAGKLDGPEWDPGPAPEQGSECSASDVAASKAFLNEKVAAMPAGCQSDYRNYLDDVIRNAPDGEKPVGAGVPGPGDAAAIDELKKLPTTADFMKLMSNKPCADALTQIAARNFVDAPSLADNIQDEFKSALSGLSNPNIALARQARPLPPQATPPAPTYSDNGGGGGGGGLDTAISILNLGTSILGLAATLSGHGGSIPTFTNFIPKSTNQAPSTNCFATHANPKDCVPRDPGTITGQLHVH